jgi:tyrosyl-tRNA synthetase
MKIEEQVTMLMQGTEYGDEQVKKAMTMELHERLLESEKSKTPLKIYCGYDPTKCDLHLGHTVTMRKLHQFQQLGHEVTFLIGDYTGLIGDPSDKDKTRPILTRQEIEENARTYAEQAFRILDKATTKIRYNSEWLAKLSFEQIIRLASNLTVQQFLGREKFRLRWEKNDPIFLHETLYAVMQGYDAYMLQADVQVGGTDQFFNIVTAARKIMSALGVKPNIAICLGILPGTDGEMKMSKSLGNDIPIKTDANDMYGKIMSIPDHSLPIYYRLVSSKSPGEVEEIEKRLKDASCNPRDIKMELALNVTSIFYGEKEALSAQQDFINRFQKHEIPEDIQTFKVKEGATVLEVLLNSGLVQSKSEARRMIAQKGVRLDDNLINDANLPITAGILRVGKRRERKIIVN